MQLNKDFLSELFKLAFRDKEILDVLRQHLKFHYLPNEEYKKLLSTMLDIFMTSEQKELPSIGQIAQIYATDDKILELLRKIKEVELPSKLLILTQLESFIKDSMSLEFYDKFADYYNENQREKAFKLLKESSENIINFSIKRDTQLFEKIYSNFQQRLKKRQERLQSSDVEYRKIPFGIAPLDDLCFGGIDVGDTALFAAQSGVGKTKLLRWIGTNAAKLGYKVLHVQAEGTKDECEEGYDATWTAEPLFNIELGDILKQDKDELFKIAEMISTGGGDIFVEAAEEFDSIDLEQVIKYIEDFYKLEGNYPDLILLDYFELFDPGDGKKYKPSEERFRREALSKKLKNIAVKYKTRIITATQASTVNPTDLNDPEFVMTRFNISEFKGVIKPFSYFITLNQTSDEYNANMMRLYTDKIRKHKGNHIITICQAYDFEKFYAHKKTLEYYDLLKKQEEDSEV